MAECRWVIVQVADALPQIACLQDGYARRMLTLAIPASI